MSSEAPEWARTQWKVLDLVVLTIWCFADIFQDSNLRFYSSL